MAANRLARRQERRLDVPLDRYVRSLERGGSEEQAEWNDRNQRYVTARPHVPRAGHATHVEVGAEAGPGFFQSLALICEVEGDISPLRPAGSNSVWEVTDL